MSTTQPVRVRKEELEIDDFGKLKKPFGKIVDKIEGGTVGAVNKIKEELQDVKRELDDARGTINKVGDFFKNFPNMIKNEFEKILGKIKDIINDALKDIKAAFAWVGKIKEFWKKFKGWIISVVCTVAVLCFVAIVGPLIMPLLSFLTSFRSAGSSMATAMAPANSMAMGASPMY